MESSVEGGRDDDDRLRGWRRRRGRKNARGEGRVPRKWQRNTMKLVAFLSYVFETSIFYFSVLQFAVESHASRCVVCFPSFSPFTFAPICSQGSLSLYSTSQIIPNLNSTRVTHCSILSKTARSPSNILHLRHNAKRTYNFNPHMNFAFNFHSLFVLLLHSFFLFLLVSVFVFIFSFMPSASFWNLFP